MTTVLLYITIRVFTAGSIHILDFQVYGSNQGTSTHKHTESRVGFWISSGKERRGCSLKGRLEMVSRIEERGLLNVW